MIFKDKYLVVSEKMSTFAGDFIKMDWFRSSAG